MKIKRKIKWILILLITAYILNGLAVSYVRAMEINRAVERQNALQANVDSMSVPELIEHFSARYGADKEVVKKVAWCESAYEIKSHDGGRAINVTAIHDNTFRHWLPKYEKDQGETLDINSTVDQVKMMTWAFGQGEEYRRAWTAYRAYKNGGTYSFYSNLMKGHYTARCK